MGRNDTRYRFVYQDIIMDIYAGKFKKGDYLPTLPELCETYQIGRNTARTAVQLLEKNGYVETGLRRPPIVCFDFENPMYRDGYIRELAQRKQGIEEVYAAMKLMMPEMFVSIVESATDEQRKEIADMVAACADSLPSSTEQELSVALYHVYHRVIAMTNNGLLNHLFTSLYHFLQVPLSSSERQGIGFKMVIPLIRVTLRTFQKQVLQEDYKGLRHQIAMFCQMAGRTSKNHLDRICRGIVVKEQERFCWMPVGQAEWLYMMLAVKLIGQIRSGVYRVGEQLPSYAQLARLEGVSEKTTRKAVALMNQLKIVRTVNGKGTIVAPRNRRNIRLIFKDGRMKDNLVAFYEALEILALISPPVAEESVRKLSLEALHKWHREAEDKQQLSWYIGSLLAQAGSPVTEAIFEQLQQILKWGYLLECLWELPAQDYFLTEELVHMLERKDISGVGSYISQFWQTCYWKAVQAGRQWGVEIHLGGIPPEPKETH